MYLRLSTNPKQQLEKHHEGPAAAGLALGSSGSAAGRTSVLIPDPPMQSGVQEDHAGLALILVAPAFSNSFGLARFTLHDSLPSSREMSTNKHYAI